MKSRSIRRLPLLFFLFLFSCNHPIVEKLVERSSDKPLFVPTADENAEDPYRRRNWFFYQRAYPSMSIPPDARKKAWRERPIGVIRPLADQKWKPVGPAPTNSFFPDNWGVTSGRINSIAISPEDPQLILVGASTGGIWRSTDGGMNFVPTTDNQVDLAVGAIAFSKSNPQIVYSGMGDQKLGYLGSGVLKSTNAGATWTRINNESLPSPGTTLKIAVDPINPDRVYLAQYSRLFMSRLFVSGFYLSTDGGVNWSRTLPGLAHDVAADPVDSQTLYLSMSFVNITDNPPGLYKSTDGGETWKSLFAAPYDKDNFSTFDVRAAVALADPKTIYVYTGGLIGGRFDVRVVVTKDGGETWKNLGSAGLDIAQFGYNTYIEADPKNADIVYVGSRDVYKSTNGGLNWTNLNGNFSLAGNYMPNRSNSHPDQHSFAFSPNNSDEIYIGNDGGISKSTNGGGSFRSLNRTLALTQFTSIALHPVNPFVTYGGTQDNGTQRRVGAAGDWKEFATGDGGKCVVDPLDPTIVYTTFIRGSISRYREGGDRFDQRIGTNSIFGESDSRPRIGFYPPFTGNKIDSTLYFGTWRLFISTDRGNTWTPPAGTMDLTKGDRDVLNAIGISRSNTDAIYTGSIQGRAMASTDRGKTWRDITAGLPDRSITSITVDPSNPKTAYLTVSGFGSGHVFKTVNGGAEWKDVSGNLPDIPVNALLIDPFNEDAIYIGTDIGVFRSTAAGLRWETFNNGLPPIVVMAFDSQPAGLIQLATYGRGAYQMVVDVPMNDIAITNAAFNKPLLTINGAGFGASGAKAIVNGADVTARLRGQTDSLITLKGNKKKLNLKKGANQIVVSARGTTSNTFIFNLN